MSADAPPLVLATIELWSLPAAAPDAADLSDLLDDEERHRAAAFLFPRDRDRFVRRRALLRLVLGDRGGLDPGAVRTEVPRGEKPALPGPDAPDFNASNTPGWSVLALSRTPGRRVGVDVERVRRLPDFDLVAPTVFTPGEMRRWADCPAEDRPPLFFRLWTRKEALLKAEGFGLAIAPATVDVPVDAAPLDTAIAADRRVPGSHTAWWLADRTIAEGVVLSLAVQRQPDDQAAPAPAPAVRWSSLPVPPGVAARLPEAVAWRVELTNPPAT